MPGHCFLPPGHTDVHFGCRCSRVSPCELMGGRWGVKLRGDRLIVERGGWPTGGRAWWLSRWSPVVLAG